MEVGHSEGFQVFELPIQNLKSRHFDALISRGGGVGASWNAVNLMHASPQVAQIDDGISHYAQML